MCGVINESNSIFLILVYSYDQNHWCPIDLRVKEFGRLSSVKYKILIDGTAIIIKIIMGKIVQIISIRFPSRRNRLVDLLIVNEHKIRKINIVINIKIIIVKSWKKIIMS